MVLSGLKRVLVVETEDNFPYTRRVVLKVVVSVIKVVIGVDEM